MKGAQLPWWGMLRLVLVGGACVALSSGVAVPALVIPGTVDTGPAVGRADISADGRLTCPGAELRGLPGAPDVAVQGNILAAAPPTAAGGSGGEISVSVAGKTAAKATVPSRAAVPLSGPAPVIVSGSAESAVGLTGRQAWVVDDRGLRGLASVACQSPGDDLWLLAGGAGVGRQERLVVVNPGANAVTATIDVHGQRGRIPASRTAVSIPPGERVSRLLDALAPGEAAPAVHVTVPTGVVVATLTDSLVRGTASWGVDTVGASPSASTRQIIPGVRLGSSALVRVVAPGSRPALATVSVRGPQGLVPLPAGSVVTVPAGGVVDLPISGLASGTYSVEVTADAPVVASAAGALADGREGDFAWFASAEPLTGVSGVALSMARGATLALRSDQGTVSVTVWSLSKGVATPTELRLPSDRVTVLQVAGESVWVAPAAGASVRASLIEEQAKGPLLTADVLRSPVLAEGHVTARLTQP